jgi:hypothetical protein
MVAGAAGVDKRARIVLHARPPPELPPGTTTMLRTLASFALCAAAAAAQVPFTIGNLIVVRVGDGTTALSGASTAVFLDEYTPTGTLVQSIPMPTVASGSNQPFTTSGSATSEGFLNLSQNGFFLTLAGYATGPGLASVATTASTATPRVIARVDLTAGIDTSTAVSDAYSGGNIRAAVAVEGLSFWTSGTSTGSGGIRHVPYGSTTSTGLNAGAPTNCRVVGIHHGQLYTSSASLSFQGVSTVGAGVSPAPGQSITPLPGFPTATGPSSYDYWFQDTATLFVADDRLPTAGGGIQKWTLSGGTWTLQYTLVGSAGCRGLSGRRVNGVTTLYATTGTQLVSVVDTGATSVVTVLASAAANTAMRGIRFLPKPSTLQRLPGGCGTADIVTSGTVEIGTDVITTIKGPLGLPFIGYGVTQYYIPVCSCVVHHDFIVLLGGPESTLAIPLNPALFGLTLYTQGIDFLAPSTCPLSPFDLLTFTDGYSFTIQ